MQMYKNEKKSEQDKKKVTKHSLQNGHIYKSGFNSTISVSHTDVLEKIIYVLKCIKQRKL